MTRQHVLLAALCLTFGVACSGDRLTTCAHCRQLAELLAADYRELEAADGHIWPITQPGRLELELSR